MGMRMGDDDDRMTRRAFPKRRERTATADVATRRVLEVEAGV